MYTFVAYRTSTTADFNVWSDGSKNGMLYIFTYDIYVLSDGAIMEWHNPVFVLQAKQ